MSLTEAEFAARDARLRRWLNGIAKARPDRLPLTTPETAEHAYRMWQWVARMTGEGFPVPDACPTPEGDVLFCWDQGIHHFEMEVDSSTGAAFLFYRDRLTGRTWGDDYVFGCLLPEEWQEFWREALRQPRFQEASLK